MSFSPDISYTEIISPFGLVSSRRISFQKAEGFRGKGKFYSRQGTARAKASSNVKGIGV